MQTDGDEYDEKPVNDSSAPRSRKISSISEIFDSSMMFIKEYEWTEVEANEPFANDFDLQHSSSDKRNSSYLSANSYISSVVEKSAKENETNLVFESDMDTEQTSLNFHKDFLFDMKSRCKDFAQSGINKLSGTLVSTVLYQKFILPFIPFNTYSNKTTQNSFESNKVSVLQKITKLKIVSKNPFMSPLLAPDEYLKQMPPVYFVVR